MSAANLGFIFYNTLVFYISVLESEALWFIQDLLT